MLPAGYDIRPTEDGDLFLLQAVERDAAELFRTAGLWRPAYESVRSREQHRDSVRAGISWVAVHDRRPCGFALGSIADGHLHLLELSVARSHQGRGLGRGLLDAVVEHARRRRDPMLTLTTDRDVPWNGPFYRRHGFVELDAGSLAPDLAAILAEEVAEGLDPARRCAMARTL